MVSLQLVALSKEKDCKVLSAPHRKSGAQCSLHVRQWNPEFTGTEVKARRPRRYAPLCKVDCIHKGLLQPGPAPRPGPSTLHLSALLQPAREQGPRDQDPSIRQGRYAVGLAPSVLLGGGSRGSGSSGGRGGPGPPSPEEKDAERGGGVLGRVCLHGISVAYHVPAVSRARAGRASP